MTPRSRSSFFRGAWLGAAPLIVWAGHFFGCYSIVALGCDQGWGHLQWGLLAFSTLALGGLGWWTAVACRQTLRSPGSTLLQVRLLAALLAMVAILWTSVPLLWLPPCHFT